MTTRRWSGCGAASERRDVLTDTTFWIDLLQERRVGRRGAVSDFLTRHRGCELCLCMITWGELAEGFPDFEELDRLLRGVRVLTLPRQIAWEASRIQRELVAAGRRLGENDCWIAATARAWGHRLVSRNRAFGRVRGLTVVPY